MIVTFVSTHRENTWTDVEHLEVDRSRVNDKVRIELRETQVLGKGSPVDSWSRQAVGTDAIEIEPEEGEDVEPQRYEFGINTIPEELDEITAERADADDAPADAEYAVSCDRWKTQRENARAIALWARRQRLAERCSVETAKDTVETARLPPADEEAVAAPPVPTDDGVLDEDPHEVLDVSPDAPDEIVEAAFKAQIRDLKGHPDSGGTSGRFQKLREAREVMLDAE